MSSDIHALHWLHVKDRMIDYKIAIVTFNAPRISQPMYHVLSDSLTVHVAPPDLLSSSRNLFHVPSCLIKAVLPYFLSFFQAKGLK